MSSLLFILSYLVVTYVGVKGDGYVVQEWLDRTSNQIQASWEIEFSTRIIILELVAATTGYIGFGLSVHGGMNKADIMIGGVSPDGKTYVGDYHGIGNTMPLRDAHEDWIILSGIENGTHTSLRLYRQLDTCDEEDVVIGEDTMNIIWALGDTDEISYHGARRGTHVANILDLITIPKATETLQEWSIVVDTPMPNRSFSYWCTIHKSPFRQKNHIVGFKPFVKTKEAIEHTHHFVIYRCEAHDHDNSIFEPFVGDGGGECYGDKEILIRPSTSCTNILYDWGAGGKALFLPDHVGFPVGEKETEYYMLEVHYNNPEKLSGIQFQTGVGVVYTPNLRQYDAGMFTVGHTVIGSLLLPPESKEFMIVGHCSKDCTQRGVPPEGVNIFNVLLHSHLRGRKMKLRHFRGPTELEWIAKDDSYHFNFQKNRPLRKERKLLPGDQMTFECTYDTIGRPNVTIAGFSTANEMCEVFVWYYPKIPMLSCSSFYDITRLFPPFGIKKVKWVRGFNRDSQPIVVEPSHMANRTFAEYIDSSVIWNLKQRALLQNELHYAPHIADCGSAKLPGAPAIPQTPIQFQPPEPVDEFRFQPKERPTRLVNSIPQGQDFTKPMDHANMKMQMSGFPPAPPELVGYPNVRDFKFHSRCPPKNLYMKR